MNLMGLKKLKTDWPMQMERNDMACNKREMVWKRDSDHELRKELNFEVSVRRQHG